MHVPKMEEVKKQKQGLLRFGALWLVLFLLCVGTALPGLYQDCSNTVSVEEKNGKQLSVKDHVVEQEIRLEGQLQSLTLACSAPSGADYGSAVVTVELQQGNVTIEKTFSAREVGSSLPLTGALQKLKPGTALLTVSGKDFPEGTDLFLSASDMQGSGLDQAKMDGSGTGGPLVLQYHIVRHNAYFYYDTVCLLLLVAVITLIAWLLAFRRGRIVNSKWLFVCSFVLLFVSISLNNPLATFFAEPRSEMAYEFWYKAKYYSFFGNLMSLMSGESLVWTERLMMWCAVKLAGNGKYVFVIAQLMQTSMICAFGSMLCLPTFKRFFPAEVRLLFCWYMGAAMLFPSAYYFWAVSYWACFFLVPFAFVDMRRLKRWQYVLALSFAAVLCVSRIYHILLIPIAIWAVVLAGKERGKRFTLYCGVIAASSAFEVLYSMRAGGSGHVNLALLKPVLFVKNAVYYQVQVLISLFFGNAKLQPVLANLVFLLFFAGIALLTVLWLFRWKDLNRRMTACVLGAMGMLSFGSILINVTVCGCSDSVDFPTNYAAPVSWRQLYYQNGDLHFSYSYFAVLVILMTLLYVGSAWVQKRLAARSPEGRPLTGGETVRTGLTIGAGCLILAFAMVNVQSKIALRMIETSWKSCYWVTENDSYFMPINVSYPYVNLNLTHNSRQIACGLTEDGQETLWAPGARTYAEDYLYSQAAPGKVSDLAESRMLSLSVRRANINFADPLTLVLKDRQGNELLRVAQTNPADRYRVDFMLKTPVEGVYSVEFLYSDGSPAYVCDGMQIGVVSE